MSIIILFYFIVNQINDSSISHTTLFGTFICVSRSSRQEMVRKKGALEISGKFTCVRHFFKKSCRTTAGEFSCEFCKNFKNTFFYRAPLEDCFCVSRYFITPYFNISVNPLQCGVAFLYPLKISENLKVF